MQRNLLLGVGAIAAVAIVGGTLMVSGAVDTQSLSDAVAFQPKTASPHPTATPTKSPSPTPKVEAVIHFTGTGSGTVHWQGIAATATALASNYGSGTCTDVGAPGASCTATPNAPTVRLTITPAADSYFAGWSGGASSCGTNTVCDVALTIGTPASVSAQFTIGTMLTVHVVGWRDYLSSQVWQGAIHVTPAMPGQCPPSATATTDCAQAYAPGSVVTLTADVPPLSKLAGTPTWIGWQGAGCGTAATCTVTIGTTPLVLTATYK